MTVHSSLKDWVRRTALGGTTKTRMIASLRNSGYDDATIQSAFETAGLNRAPEQIDYEAFYNTSITAKARKVDAPGIQLYVIEEFLTAKECDDLIEYTRQNANRSRVVSPEDEPIVSDYRTSSTASVSADLNHQFSPIDRRICDALGLNPNLGERMQVQWYQPGQYYKEHTDYFKKGTEEYEVYTELMGQRTWTCMIYLNTVEQGGETYFKHLDQKFSPIRGLALAWNSLDREGEGNPNTKHESLPPVGGDKYVITKWFRSWPLI